MNITQETIYNNVNAFTTTMEIVYNNGVKQFIKEELIDYLDNEDIEDIKVISDELDKRRFNNTNEFNLDTYLFLNEYMDIKEDEEEGF